MRIARIITLLLLVFTMLQLVGCGNEEASVTSSSYEVIDAQGTVIKLPHKPTRIMTTHFHLDNMLLGIVEQERVVAVSSTMLDPNVSYIAPEDVAKPVKLSFDTPFEQIVALKPDLIIARASNGAERIQSFRDLGIPVYVTIYPSTVEDVKKQIRGITEVVGEKERGDKLIAKLNQELQSITNVVQAFKGREQSIMLVSKMNHNYGGKGSSFDDMCHYAQLKNAPAEIGVMNGQLMDKEVMLRANPDHFVLSEAWEIRHGELDAYKKEFLDDPAIRHLKAVQRNQVHYIPDRYLYASHQNCIWAIRKLASLAYGEDLFPEKKETFLKGY